MVAELVGEHDSKLTVVEAPVEQRVPEEDAAARPDAGCVGVRDRREIAPLLDLDLHRLRVLAVSEDDRVAPEILRRRPAVDHVRVDEGE